MNIREILDDNVNGATFVAIDTCTPVKLTGGKANPQQGRVVKVMTGANVMVFSNSKTNGYNNMVQRRLGQEGKDPQSFVLSPRQWGERETGTPFVNHKGNLYLEVIFLRAGEVKYHLDNNEVSKEQIVGLGDKEEGHQGGLENKVIIRTYNVDNITAIRVNRQRYVRNELGEFQEENLVEQLGA